MNDVAERDWPVVELRQYTLHPGQRDVLIDLFDRQFVEGQEAAGMAVFGQFRDLDAPDRFVWLRGFADMTSRAEALLRFYGGPVWKEHSVHANATMIDSDNVLLLRPTNAGRGFPVRTAARAPIGHTEGPPPSVVQATLYYRDRPFDDAFHDFFDSQVRPTLVETGAVPLVCLQSEYAENTFPALPVRTGEHVFVWFAAFPSPAQLSDHQDQLERSEHWQSGVLPALSTMLSGPAEQLRLAPTARSLLR